MKFKIPFGLLGGGLLIFFLTLGLTLVGTFEVLRSARVYLPEPAISIWYLLFLFLILTALLLLFLRIIPGRFLFTAFFSLAMFSGVWFIADIFFSGNIAVLIGAALLIARYLVARVVTQNLLVILGVSGVATSVGLDLPWKSVLILSLILSVYDIAAVYGTHHMVTMMRGLLARGVIFAAVVPERGHGFFERLDRVHPGEGFMLIGTGDLAIPAIFVASLAGENLTQAIGASIGAAIGFIGTNILFLTIGERKPMPALPPIVIGMGIGFLISWAMSGY